MLTMVLLALMLAQAQKQEVAATPESPDGPVVVIGDPRAIMLSPLSSPTARSQTSGTKSRPNASLRSSHQFLQSPLFGQPAALLTVTITNADETYWCPEILWVWPNGTESVQEGDCPPFEQAPPAEVAYRTFTRSVPIAMPSGRWAITAKLRKMGRVIRTLSVSITVIGGE